MDETLLILIPLAVLLIGVIYYYKPLYEGFESRPVTDSASELPGIPLPDISGCAAIPLSKFDVNVVLSYISPDIQYAIMSYSIGSYNYLPTIQKAFKQADTSTQMAMSALLGRYLAFNGGSAAIPGPGYTNTSPGNYVAQMKGATDLLNPATVDTSSPVYPSFDAAKTVAMCPQFNKGWVSTADF